MDFFPTICEVAGVDVPEDIEGKSLLRLYQGTGSPIRNEVFATFISEPPRWNVRAVRTTRYKYIKHLTTDEVELFDLRSDPHEMTNLADTTSYRKIQRSLAAKLTAWRNRSGDQRNDRMLLDEFQGHVD